MENKGKTLYSDVVPNQASTKVMGNKGKTLYSDVVPNQASTEAMENKRKTLYSDVVPRFPEHLKEKMEELPLEQQRRLYLDIFKPLDFYELLFELYFKKSPEAQTFCDEQNKK